MRTLSRSFDYDRARELRSRGLSYPEIAKQLGVSHQAVMYACDEAYRERKNEAAKAYARTRRAAQSPRSGTAS